MCNVIGIKLTNKDYVELGDITKPISTIGDLPKVQSGFSYGDWAILKNDNSDIEIAAAHWEFIPPFIKDENDLFNARKQGIPWLNATSEKLMSSKMFADAALQRRCLIPISYFFEWKHVGKNKIPYAVSVSNEELFYVAGIWQPWLNKSTGEQKDCFAMVTTVANELMANIHNTKKRMPTILPSAEASSWLFDNLTENQIEELAKTQIQSEKLAAFTVNKNFQTLANPCEPFEYDVMEQGSLF
jgi:putative SOS response-associated peptidase YedK